MKDAHVAQEGGRVYGMQECRSGGWGNKHSTFKEQMTIVIVPVKEGGARKEGSAIFQSGKNT